MKGPRPAESGGGIAFLGQVSRRSGFGLFCRDHFSRIFKLSDGRRPLHMLPPTPAPEPVMAARQVKAYGSSEQIVVQDSRTATYLVQGIRIVRVA
jgi:hypothetical protein